jgi:hypothetical protein
MTARSLRACDKRSFCGAELRGRQLPSRALSSNMLAITTSTKQGTMFDARKFLPLSSAVAGETAVRFGGNLLSIGVPGMAHRTASYPIYRGVLR